MSTSTEQINQLIGGYTDLKTYFEGERSRIEAARIAALGSVAATVREEMHYDVLLDPDITTNVADREFASLTEVINAAPAGGFLTVRIPGDKVVDFNAGVTALASSFFFKKEGSGGRPRINVKATTVDGENRYHRITSLGGAAFRFWGVDISLEGEADPSLGWRTDSRSWLRVSYGSPGIYVGLQDSIVSGPAGLFLTSAHLGSVINVGLRNVTVDTCGIVGYANDGVAVIAKSGVTLLNGAALQSGGTPVSGNVMTN